MGALQLAHQRIAHRASTRLTAHVNGCRVGSAFEEAPNDSDNTLGIHHRFCVSGPWPLEDDGVAGRERIAKLAPATRRGAPPMIADEQRSATSSEQRPAIWPPRENPRCGRCRPVQHPGQIQRGRRPRRSCRPIRRAAVRSSRAFHARVHPCDPVGERFEAMHIAAQRAASVVGPAVERTGEPSGAPIRMTSDRTVPASRAWVCGPP